MFMTCKPPLYTAEWVKVDTVQKSEMIVLFKVKTLPIFQCNMKALINYSLNQF